MEINAAFEDRIIIDTESMNWIESPVNGISRRPLDRVGEEVARATSVVRYASGSEFSPHVHTGGEEFFVLDGVFQDEHGDFPKGSYIRNPPQSKHKPGSKEGCTILVKLWQFEPSDRVHVRLNSNFMQSVPHRNHKNISVVPLYIDQYEEVSIQYWDANSTITLDAEQGLEAFVLDGEFKESGDNLGKHNWLRLPMNSKLIASVGSQGAKVWLKQHHLKHVDAELARLKVFTAKT